MVEYVAKWLNLCPFTVCFGTFLFFGQVFLSGTLIRDLRVHLNGFLKENSLTLDQLAEETVHRRARPKAMSNDDVTSVDDDVTEWWAWLHSSSSQKHM